MERILSKITSGKWILTMCAGLVFIYATVTRILPEEAIASIVTMVFTLYFTKDKGGNNEKTNGSSNATTDSYGSES